VNTTLIFLQIAGPYMALAAGLGVCIYLIISVKASLRRSVQETEITLAAMRDSVKAAEASLVALRADLRAAEEQFRISAGAPVKSWSNISNRTQALRMLRAGLSPQHIAAELSLSGGEVELIAKVSNIAVGKPQSQENQPRRSNEGSIFSINA
jgi:hypothetical protein